MVELLYSPDNSTLGVNMTDGPFKQAFETDLEGVVLREIISYRNDGSGNIRVEKATRTYFTDDYVDTTQVTVLLVMWSNYDPTQKMADFYQNVPSDGVLIPTTDEVAYEHFEEHRWVYNKLYINETQDIPCGPVGTEPTEYHRYVLSLYITYLVVRQVLLFVIVKKNMTR